MKKSGNGVPPLFSQSQDTPIGFFDPDEPVANLTGNLPDWRQDTWVKTAARRRYHLNFC
jgi:hypothetical protein